MRCRTCDYPLWNLAARICPECGSAFTPSDFEFVPNAVKFCCPHCDQSYYGTDSLGHLVPHKFNCVQCHVEVAMEQMVLRPADGNEGHTNKGSVPWIERRKRGRARALLVTILMALFTPGKLARAIPQRASTAEALAYGCTLAMFIGVVGGLVPVMWLWMFEYSWMLADERASYPLFIGAMLAVILAAGAWVVAWALTTHLILRLTGGCSHSADRTIQAFCYSTGANAAGALPCGGVLIGWLWWMVSAVIMVAQAQRVHCLRAALAVVVLPTVTFSLIISGSILLWATLEEHSHAPDPAMQTISSLAWTLEHSPHGAMSGEEGPRHAIDLLAAAPWWYSDPKKAFCQPGTMTTPATIPIGELTLEEFLKLPRTQQMRIAADFIEALPDNLIAHRFGDFIFTYHSGTANGLRGSWLVVMLPDPDVNGQPHAGTVIRVAEQGWGRERQFTLAELPEELRQENAYRASLGLPPLPDLTTITHSNPAVAPGPEGTSTNSEE